LSEHEQRITGCLLGTAVGDALGLPAEGLTPTRQRKLFPRMDGFQLLFGRGLVSDDTEHAVLTLAALRDSGGETEAFRREIRRGLRRWFWTLPPGIGLGTLRAGLRLSFGLTRTGVRSAGNGPAMRAPIIAAWTYPERRESLLPLVKISTETTHIDPRAFYGSLVLARLTHQLLDGQLSAAGLVEGIDDQDCLHLVARVMENPQRAPQQLCVELGFRQGVTGYIYHTLAVVLQACVRADVSFRQSLVDTVRCGGDSDSTAALVGGILGAVHGSEAIPDDWKEGLRDWPLDHDRLVAVATQQAGAPGYPSQLARNLVVGPCLLVCALRRVLPPY
jgi:ADP-ribosylglycohydrolase